MPPCPWGLVGASPAADLWDFCGARRRPSAAHAAVCLRTSDSGLRAGFAVRPAWLATGSGADCLL
jgi:hypothetical protein